MKTVLVVAPHPDDETLGVGGTLLKHRACGDQLHWLVMTHVQGHPRFTLEFAKAREVQLSQVSESYGFVSTRILPFLAATLDQVLFSKVLEEVSLVLQELKPQVIYVPYAHDVHTDHQITAKALTACTKSFRSPWIESVYAYETLSETDYASFTEPPFRPNVFVDISDYQDSKEKILSVYASEIQPVPFPRSLEAVRALAKVRGAQCYVPYAESFMLLKQKW